MSRSSNYFNRYLPSYSAHAYSEIGDYLKKKKGKISVLDVGCGDCSGFGRLESKTVKMFGLEEAISYNAVLIPEVRSKVFFYSILDRDLTNKIKKKFDGILMVRILHHLVSDNPRKSTGLALKAIENSAKLLKEGGEIIIYEPIFKPKSLSKLLFYIKRFFSLFTKKRIGLFGYWSNLGDPVVNYFTENELKKLIVNFEVVESKIYMRKPPFVISLFFKRADLFLVIKNR